MSTSKDLANFVRTVMLIADEIERHSDTVDIPYLSELGMGYGAALTYLRFGVKAVISLQEDCSKAKFQTKIAKISENNAMNFLEDIFGNTDIAEINESDKARIREFVRKIENECGKF